MTFRDIIEGMHRQDAAIRCGALAGLDGLAVEEWQASPPAHDVPALCAEIAQFFREGGRIADENGLGGASEMFLGGERGMVLVRKVTDDYFLLLVVEPGAVPGKCRFQLRRAARRAREML